MTRRRPPRRRLASAAVLAIAALVMIVQAVGAFGLLGVLLGEAVVQVVGSRVEERKDRAAVNARRDSRLRDLDLEEAGIAVKVQRGWLTPQQAEAEVARIATRREAIRELAKRERQIISFQTRRQIEEQFWQTLPDAVAAATGANRRVVDLVTGLVRGENPLQAIVAAALREPAADPRETYRDLARQLADVRAAAAALGGAETIDVRARLDALVREAAGLADLEGIPPDDKLQRLGELTDAVGAAAAQLGTIAERLLPESPGIARERFAGDERWVVLSASAEALDANSAKQAVVSSVMRRSADRAEAIARAAGISMDDPTIEAIALDALTRWVAARTASDGLDGATVDLDALVRDAIDESLQANGLPPLPGSPEATPGASAEPVRRRFMGQGTFAHDYEHRSGASCSVTITVDMDLVLEADGTATLFLGDTPIHALSEDASTATCLASGQPQIYAGTWVPGAADGAARITYGSTEDAIDVAIGGSVPTGHATAAFVYSHRIYGGYRIEFDLAEVE